MVMRTRRTDCVIMALALLTFGLVTPSLTRAAPPPGFTAFECGRRQADEVQKLIYTLLPASEQAHILIDPAANQILVSGSPQALRLAEQVVQSVQRPAAADRNPQAVTVVAYACPLEQQADALAMLRREFGQQPQFQVTGDGASDQLFVVASPSVQQRISELLDSTRRTNPSQPAPLSSFSARPSPPGTGPPASRGARAAVPTEAAQGWSRLPIRTPPDELRDRLAHLIGHRLTASEPNRLELRDRDGLLSRIEFQGSDVLVQGPEAVRLQVSQLIAALDTAPTDFGRRLGVVAFHRSSPQQRTQAIQAYRGGQPGRSAPVVQPTGPARRREAKLPDAHATPWREPAAEQTRNGSDEANSDAGRDAAPPFDQGAAVRQAVNQQLPETPATSGLAFAGFLFQQADDTAPTTNDLENSSANPPRGGTGKGSTENGSTENGSTGNGGTDNGGTGGGSTTVAGVAGDVDVEVETLPDLDVIILRGRDRDVERLSKIIQELERLSEATQPEIRIRPLQHANSEAVGEIVERVREDIAGVRQGRVSITPLVKPNALLLIGWGEAIASIEELVAQLDTPVAADSQFAVFRLRHAAATQVQQSLQQFFTNRTGLGPRLNAVADLRSNAVIVHAAPRDLAEAERMIEALDTPRAEMVTQAQIIKVQNTLATDLAATLQAAITAANRPDADAATVLELLTVDADGRRMLASGVLQDVTITANVRNNTLIVSGPVDSLPLVQALIQQLDAPVANAQIKVFRITNADAAALVRVLQSLLPTPAANTIQPNLSSAPGESSLAPLRFSVDTRTNSIIATGSGGDLQIVEALLLRLDERDTAQRKNEIYRLRNAPANDVAAAINEFLRSERVIQQAAPGTENAFEQIEREVVVVPEPIGNSLIISATARYFNEIRNLVEELDAQPLQVLIQVLIAEVMLNNTDEFGVELGIQDSVLFDRSLLSDIVTTTETVQKSTVDGIITSTSQVIQSATNQPGFGFNNEPPGNSGSSRALAGSDQIGTQGLSHFAVGRVNNELGFGGLVLSASSESLSVLIRALQESRRLDVLSRPQVRTLDNQPAFIQVGQRVPRIVASNISGAGFQTNQVALENVGLIVGVTPRISPNGTVVMEVDAEKSSLGPEQEGIPISVATDGAVIRSPRIDITTAQATVSAASGETIILGGLITKTKTAITRRVPYLADIPLLGDLFRFDSYQDKRSELLIILTPHVIHGAEDDRQLLQQETSLMSWCAADVSEFLYDTNVSLGKPPLPNSDAATEVIYPHLNPRGWTNSNSPAAEAPQGSPATRQQPADPALDSSSLPAPSILPAPDDGRSESPSSAAGPSDLDPQTPVPQVDSAAANRPSSASPFRAAVRLPVDSATVPARQLTLQQPANNFVQSVPHRGATVPRAQRVRPTTAVGGKSPALEPDPSRFPRSASRFSDLPERE